MPLLSFNRYGALCNRSLRPVTQRIAQRTWPRFRLSGNRVGLHMVVVGGSLLGLLACTIIPTPLTPDDLTAVLLEDQKDLFNEQEALFQPIDLYEAVARAIKYNLDYRVTLLEKTVALTEVDLSNYDLLPRLAARAGFDSRNAVEASSGRSLSTGVISTSYSTAQDQEKQYADLGVVWNILDFGVSYFQAKQAADRLLVSEENRRKLAHSQFQEVQSAFWRAASAQQLQSRIEPVLKEAKAALAVAHQVEKERLRPQLEMMRFQRELLDVVQQLETLREELDMAKKNLALLLNLPPGTPFELSVPDESCLAVTPIRATVTEMEQLALMNRPELRMEVYKSRISAAETRKALLRMLPGLELKSSTHYDSNSYAMDSNWQDAGLQITGNLMKLVSGPTAIRLADNQTILSQLRRVALNMAILSQVHISYRKYWDANRKLERFSTISAVDQRILDNMALDSDNTSQNRLEQIRAATRAIMSQLQRNKAYAEVQNAIGMIFVSLGVDLLPTATQQASLSTLTQSIQEAIMAWQEGISLPPDMNAVGGEFAAGRLNPASDQRFNQEMESLLLRSNKGESNTPLRAQAITPDEPKQSIANRNTQQSTDADDIIRQTIESMHNPATAEASKPPAAPVAPQPLPTTPNTLQPPPPPPVANSKNPAPVANSKNLESVSASSDQILIEEESAAAAPTPSKAAAAPSVAARPPVTPVPTKEAVQTLVKEWADAWARQDAQTFLAFYSEQFLPENSWNRAQWTDAYTTFLNPSTQVRVALSDVAIEVESENQAIAFVRLAFTSASSKWEKRKTLRLLKEQKQWRIVAEQTDNRPAQWSALTPALANPTERR